MSKPFITQRINKINKLDVKMKLHHYFNITKTKEILSALLRAILIIGLSFIILYPIIQLFSLAFMDLTDVNNPRVVWIPQHFTLDNIRVAIEILDYNKSLFITIGFSAAIMIIQTFICALAGYAFARLKFKGSNILFIGVIATILVPPQTIMLPMYLNFKNFDIFGLIKLFRGQSLNLLNSWVSIFILAVVGMGLKSGLYIYIFRQFFRGIPKELEEAAFLDGAGIIKTFNSVMLPCAKSSVVTVMLFSFVWQWNDKYYATLFYANGDLLSLNLMNAASNMKIAIQRVLDVTIGANETVSPLLVSLIANTSALMVILPLLILYLFVQRQFVEGVERAGIKG